MFLKKYLNKRSNTKFNLALILIAFFISAYSSFAVGEELSCRKILSSNNTTSPQISGMDIFDPYSSTTDSKNEILQIEIDAFELRLKKLRRLNSQLKYLDQERTVIKRSIGDYLTEEAYNEILNENKEKTSDTYNRIQDLGEEMNEIASEILRLRGVDHDVELGTSAITFLPSKNDLWGELAENFKERYNSTIRHSSMKQYGCKAMHCSGSMETFAPHEDIITGRFGLTTLHELDHAEISRLIALGSQSFLGFQLESENTDFDFSLWRMMDQGYQHAFRADELLTATHNMRDRNSFNIFRKRISRMHSSLTREVSKALRMIKAVPDNAPVVPNIITIPGLRKWKLISTDIFKQTVWHWAIPVSPEIYMNIRVSPELNRKLKNGGVSSPRFALHSQRALENLTEVLEKAESDLGQIQEHLKMLYIYNSLEERHEAITNLRNLLLNLIGMDDNILLDHEEIYRRFR